ncbi:NAD-dependent epimerase/dehydratase family protein [Streptomyces sp. NBC_00335]|uniref:NAD-dependent epimerase/dehydratase family protein n=1 Tax=Streptomyces sp. NBC_00335 TaxID=2975714 RepID=UPI003FA796D4
MGAPADARPSADARGRRVLATGGACFIGSHGVSALAERGREPLVLYALLPAAHPGEPELPDAEFLRGDVRDAKAVRAALRGVDAMCHRTHRLQRQLGTTDSHGECDASRRAGPPGCGVRDRVPLAVEGIQHAGLAGGLRGWPRRQPRPIPTQGRSQRSNTPRSPC